MKYSALRGCLCVMLCVATLPALAQTNNGGGNNGGGNNGGRGNNNNNRNSSGIQIDAAGLMTAVLPSDADAGLDHRRRAALARKSDGGDWTQPSECRKVSLNRLEEAYVAAVRAGQPLPTDLTRLAGLQQIDYLFVLPESGDLVIAGPAEGCVPDTIGRMVGVESGRPALNLEDFCVVWRALATEPSVGCSIDPEPARLARLQQYLAQNSSAATIHVVEQRFRMMPEILGPQNVTVVGVPADSHTGAVLVEADWRMKRISLGLEHHGVKGLRSHLEMLTTAGGNSMQRWYFVPLYDELVRSRDGMTYAFRGQHHQLVAQEELTDVNGTRSEAPTTRVSTTAFARQFTKRFPDLAAKSPVFAELQNIIDWTLISSLIRRDGLAQKVGWSAAVFSDPVQSDYTHGAAPKTVASLVNAKRSANTVIGLVGGGVSIGQKRLLDAGAWQAEDGQRLDGRRITASEGTRSEAHLWWWD